MWQRGKVDIRAVLVILFVIAVLPGYARRKEVSKLRNVKVEQILDGDSIVVREQAYTVGRPRDRYVLDLAGISAPPPDDEIGEDAVKFLKQRVLRKSADAEYLPEMNGWKVSAGGIRDLSAEMIERGLARRVNDRGAYTREEERAKDRKRGIWKQSDLPGGFTEEELELYDDTLHTAPDSFHDISEGIQRSNYVQQQPQFQQGNSYDLTLAGSDSFYERATVPRTLYVYPTSRRRVSGLFFIITGMDYRIVEELRPDDSVRISCIFIKMVMVRDLYGFKNVPLFKYRGNAPTLGVGGELMYYE